MARHDPPPSSFSQTRRLGIGLSVAISLLALLATVLMVNYLAARHFKRYQWTTDARYKLSPVTEQVLQALTNTVNVTILFNRNEPLFAPVSGLLKEYAYACSKVSVEHVDYTRDLGRAQLVMAKYQLPQAEADLVVFETNLRTKVVRATELSEYDWTSLLAGGKEVRRSAFKGEPLFTSAIASLQEAKAPKAYYLQGHGEHSLSSDDPIMGYSQFGRLLQQKNIEFAPLTLPGREEVPEDCQLLIVAGPQNRLDQAELEKINRYLSQGGRLLSLLSFYRSETQSTGMERLLASWGVMVGDDYSYDSRNTMTGNDVICTNYAAHPVTKPLQGSSVYLVLARSIRPIATSTQSPDAPRVEPLLMTSQDGYTKGTNPLRDLRGAIPLAAAVEKGSLQGVGADRGSTRIVVVGESVFLGNQTIVKYANLDFANLAVNWLLDRPRHLAGLVPRPIQEYRIAVSRSDMLRLRWLLLGAFPGTVILLGVLVWYRRRA